ncbi:MAG TPA: GNAT family N-acetyltransferase [Acidimicrobiales bacterium]|nr:GNAT family N-acetyltransferase [Acidimicrobiales bacterium]
MGAHLDVIRWGRERVRTGPWRGNAGIAYLSPLPDAPVPSVVFVRRCLDQLAAKGCRRVITSALAPAEQVGFLAAGFDVHERLHLLAHDLRRVPRADVSALRRAVPGDHPAVLDVDARAFPGFWRIDDAALGDALTATPNSRFRVAAPGGVVVGYAVTGRAGRRGFLQRLAVDPACQRQGLGRALAVDALRWLRRWRVEQAVVNTQVGNEAALALYESLGFRREPAGLCVLTFSLEPRLVPPAAEPAAARAVSRPRPGPATR